MKLWHAGRKRHALRRSPQGERGLKCCMAAGRTVGNAGRSPQGERGLKCIQTVWVSTQGFCRSPQGERGLKCRSIRFALDVLASLPARGAWIEIFWACPNRPTPPSLPARGAWIEIAISPATTHARRRRSPQGERGLKFEYFPMVDRMEESLPARGAWIEIEVKATRANSTRRSPQGERGLK